MNSVHFYLATLGLAFGIFWQSVFPVTGAVMIWLLVIAVALYFITRRSQKGNFYEPLILIALFLVFVSLGLWRFDLAHDQALAPDYEARIGEEIKLIGVVAREPEVRDKSTHLYVRVEKELLLMTADRYQEVAYGDEVAISGELQKPEAFATDLGRTFDYPNYLLARGVAYIIPFADVTVIESGQGWWLLERLYDSKQYFLTTLESLLVEPEVGLAEGLLLGVKRAIGEELETVFRQTGIIHIVVLSGYNIMIVVAFVMYLLSRSLNKTWQVIFGVAAIMIFAILVGLSATVVRASIMACLLLIVGLTGRAYIALRGLFLAAAIMLLINPYLLAFDAGFQLSFLATLGLILLSPLLVPRFQFVPAIIGMREFFTATIATQIMVLPLLLYSIGEFSLVAVIVNVLVLPMVPLAMLLTFLTGVVGLVLPTLAVPVAFLAHLSLTYIIKVATAFALLPFASVVVPAFPFILVPLAYTIIFYIIYRTKSRQQDPSFITEELADWIIEEESVVLKPASKIFD